MKKIIVTTSAALLLLGGSLQARADAVGELQSAYKTKGAQSFSAAAGKELWDKTFKDAKTGESRDCSTCHGKDLTKPGKHKETGKVIDPLAPSANNKRLTDVKFIEKWFTRNCKWVVGRECTPQEKGDVLEFLRTQ